MAQAMTRSAGSLGRFQDAFARALLDPDAVGEHDAALAKLIAQSSFSVYRNTVLKGCIDALAANYPAVLRLVGEEWFRDAAAVYARRKLPRQPMLLDYGADFAQFLAGFEPAAELPYLAGVAQLDRCWSEAHFARDEAPLEAASIARLAPAQLAGTVLRPHASARWVWFETMPIRTIWQRNRQADATRTAGGEIDWRGEGVLIVRPHGAVESTALDAAGCAFMDACAHGRTLTDAVQVAAEVEGSVDLAQLTAALFSSGAFAQPQLS
jgi:hypothetical protein